MEEFENIALKAYKNIPLNEFAELPEKYAYLQLKYLYYSYKCGDLSKIDAEIKKREIMNEYKTDCFNYKRCMEICNEYNKNKMNNEMKIASIEKSKDKEEILRLALEAIGIFISDSSFASRNIGKLEQIDF